MADTVNVAEPSFDIKIAERTIRVYPLTSHLAGFCRDYVLSAPDAEQMPVTGSFHSRTDNALTAPETDITVRITQDDIDHECELAEKEDLCRVTDAYLETLALARKVAAGLLNYDTILFHASCIAVDGEGYCFAAPSGVGKSTHTWLWRDLLGDRVIYINDDKPFLKIAETGVTAYGSPWDGGHHLSSNLSVPVRAVYLLSRGEKNIVKDLDADEAYPLLLAQIYRPHDEEALKKILPLTDLLCRSVELFSLECNMEPEAAMTAYGAVRR